MTNITYRSDIKVNLVDYMGDDQTVARSARVSTGNDLIIPEKIEGLINYLVRENHTSTLEHNVVTLRIEAPIFIAREWMRHRTQAYNEISGRYAKLKPEFYLPSKDRPLVNAGSGAHPELVFETEGIDAEDLYDVVTSAHKEATEQAWYQYENMLAHGVATEVARNVLPVSIYTSFYATANLNNWFKFLYLRDGLNGHPQYEIAQGAQQVKAILGDLYPLTMKAMSKHRIVDTPTS